MCVYFGEIKTVLTLLYVVFFALLIYFILNQDKEYKGSIISEFVGPLTPIFVKGSIKKSALWARPIFLAVTLLIVGLWVWALSAGCNG